MDNPNKYAIINKFLEDHGHAEGLGWEFVDEGADIPGIAGMTIADVLIEIIKRFEAKHG